MALAETVSNLVGRLERDLGVDGTELTLLFCLAVVAVIALLLGVNRYSKRKGLRLAHAGRFAAPDPYARSFHLLRPAREQSQPDPMTMGPARDASNPRFRPDVILPQVPDPFYPSLEKVRAAAAAAGPSIRLSGETASSGPADEFESAPGEPASPLIHNEPPPSLVPGSAASPIAGWYQDPEGSPGSLRYWDGSAWTQRRPA